MRDLKDGASETLLLSENLQATEWFPTTGDPPAAYKPHQADVGMIWWLSDAKVNTKAPDTAWINCGKDDPVVDPTNWRSRLQYARPSSNHIGGVVAAYCDGHVGFLDDDTDHRGFQQLMAPDDAKASRFFIAPGQ